VEEWFGLQPTGRQFREPTGTAVELVDAEGLICTGLAFDAPWHGHAALTRPISLVRSFLEYPMVVGLVELTHVDLDHARFTYPTGTVYSLKEVMRIHGDLGLPVGPRAALELAWLAGHVLVEGAQNGGVQGCFSHGGLTPWRIALRADANLQILGYGIPQVDVLAWRSNPERVPHADSVRYAPPERLTGIPEDDAADTAALTIIAYEVMTGKPLYGGHDPAEIVRSASISEAVPMLSRPNELPRDIAQVFARSLVFDPDSRLRGEDWLAEIGSLLEAHPEGDSLEVVLERIRGAAVEGTRRARIQQTAETSAFTPAALAALANEEDDPAPEQPKPARWQKAAERRREPSGGRTPSETPVPALPRSSPTTGEVDAPTRRRRRDASDAASPARRPASADPLATGEVTEAAPRRRTRGAVDREDPGASFDLSLPEEEESPHTLDDAPLDLAVDEEDAAESDDLLLEAAETDQRPRIRRRADTENVPSASRRRRRPDAG
jgi:hypothetical protein